jgi:hypothetical protein
MPSLLAEHGDKFINTSGTLKVHILYSRNKSLPLRFIKITQKCQLSNVIRQSTIQHNQFHVILYNKLSKTYSTFIEFEVLQRSL